MIGANRSERRLKVMMIDPNANTPPYDRALCAALAAKGCDVELVTAPFVYEQLSPPVDFRLTHGFFRLLGNPRWSTLFSRATVRRAIKTIEYPADYAWLAAHISRERPDVVHWQWSFSAHADATFARWLRFRGIASVYTVHNLVPHEAAGQQSTPWRSPLFGRTSAVIVHSERSKSLLLGTLGPGSPKVLVAPHGPPLPAAFEVGTSEARQRLGLPAGAHIALFAGLIEPYKGLDTLIEAFAGVAARDPAAFLVVAGRPNHPIEPYRRRLAELGLSQQAYIEARFMPGERLATYLCAADAVVLPYRDTTASGMLMAAWQFGRPVVASAVGDLSELIVEGRSGTLVPPMRANELAQAILRIFEDQPFARRVGEGGRERGRTDQSWEVAAQRTAALYNHVADEMSLLARRA
ncbi:MAG: glycosyltransferase [Chloroflexota bacterium]